MANHKRENLLEINEWCKSVSVDEIVYVRNALYHNGRVYRLSISKNGIGVRADGRFSSWLHTTDGSNSLFDLTVGSELIYKWESVKERILNALEEHQKRKDIMENFTV